MILPALALLAASRFQTPPLAYAVEVDVKVGLFGGTPSQADALARASPGLYLARVVWYATATPPYGTPKRDPAAVRAAWAARHGLSFSSAAQNGYSPSFASLPNPDTGLAAGSLQLAGGDVSIGVQTREVTDYGVTTCPTMDDAKALVRAVYCLKDPPMSVLGRWDAAAQTFDSATRIVWTAWPPLPAEPYSLMR